MLLSFTPKFKKIVKNEKCTLENYFIELCYPFSTSQLIKDYTPIFFLYHILLPSFIKQIQWELYITN
jgi:hypothetical protein